MVTTAPMHPARRRRLAERTPPEPVHDVLLRPLGGDGNGLIIEADERDFLPSVLADLEADDWRARIAARRQIKRGRDGVPELSQPIQRRFHLILLEAVCRVPGFPRIAPEKLAGMGLVLRRQRDGRPQAWMSEGGRRKGWLDIAHSVNADPDPQPPGAEEPSRALASLDRLLREQRGADGMTEQIIPLFVAPPDICEARGRTILLATIPLTSSETTEDTETFDFSAVPDEDADALRLHLSSYLKRRAPTDMPRAGQVIDPDWQPLNNPVPNPDEDATVPGRLFALARFLQQLTTELGFLEDLPSTPELRNQLSRIDLIMERDGRGVTTRTLPADQFVEAAIPILLSGEPNPTGLTMPLVWPRIGTNRGRRLTNAAIAALSERFAQVAPKTPKFERDSDQYTVRAFVRVRGHDHCPPRLVWSETTAPFRIRPWWDNDAPPIRVSLPTLADVRNVKPNVAFEMPPELANLLQSDPQDLLEGKRSEGRIGLGWLCSFSLPIITLCAFIVLNIFLGLFNLFFQWLLWIKICIPYPRPK